MRIKTKVCPDIKEGYANSKSPRGAISEVYLELVTLTTLHSNSEDAIIVNKSFVIVTVRE